MPFSNNEAIPVFGQYKPVIEGFTYEPEKNAYRCPAGKLLPFRNYCTSQDGHWLKNYRGEYRDCQACPRKPTCVPSATQKKLVRSPYDAAYLRAWQRQQSRAGQRRRRVRQGTVEPVFGNLLHHYGLRRVNTKGQAAAHKTMLLTAIAYNLKKLLKHQPKRAVRVALACQVGLHQLAQGPFCWLRARRHLPRNYAGRESRHTAEFCNSHAPMLDGIRAVPNLPENVGFWGLFSGAVFWRVFSGQNMPSYYMEEAEEDEFYGIDKDHAHPRALELAPEAFFWSCGDELAPFGSDEGDMALREFRDWRKENPTLPALDCLIWTIESVGEMDIDTYDDSLLVPATIQTQLTDSDFDDVQYIHVLDVSVIATGFGQLVDEGLIELEAKPLIERAIERQRIWSKLGGIPLQYQEQYNTNLRVLSRILAEA